MQKTHYYKSVIPGFSLDEVIVCQYYDADMQRKIHRFKFVHNRVDRVYFTSLFAHMREEFPPIGTVIVYPPVSMKDRILRGPNHAKFLAQYFLSASKLVSNLESNPPGIYSPWRKGGENQNEQGGLQQDQSQNPISPLEISSPLKRAQAKDSDSVNDTVSSPPFKGVARSAGGMEVRLSEEIFLTCPFFKKFFASHQSQRTKKERQDIQSELLFNEKFIEKIRGKDIILVDDLITTGYTAHTLGKFLKSAGAKSVVGYFLASEKIE